MGKFGKRNISYVDVKTQTELRTNRIRSEIMPSVGDVVLIKDEDPRRCWKLGRTKTLIKSNYWHCRSAKVLLPNGREIGRTSNLLLPIEVTGHTSGLESGKNIVNTRKWRSSLKTKRRAAIEAAKKMHLWLEQYSKHCKIIFQASETIIDSKKITHENTF